MMYDNSQDYEYHRILPDGIMLAAYRTVFGNGRLVWCESVYSMGPSGSWCYPSLTDAIAAMNTWEPGPRSLRPPDGWFREIHTGWRRTDGDPAQEYHHP